MSVQSAPPTSASIRAVRWSRRGRLRLGARWNGIAAIIAVIVIIGLPVLALIGPYPIDPFRPDPNAIGIAPNGVHWFGTDGNGMDVFARTIEAAKLDVPISVGGAQRTPHFQIGPYFPQSVGAAATDRYDSIKVWSCP